MYTGPELKRCVFEPLYYNRLTATVPEWYFSTFKSTAFGYTKGVKCEEQSMPYSQFFTDKKETTKWTVKCDHKYTVEGA
jgi:hypothetical protein